MMRGGRAPGRTATGGRARPKARAATDKGRKEGFGGLGNLAYANARVKARRTKLLPREDLLKMMRMDVHQVTRLLGESIYRRDIDELGTVYSGIDLLERASSRNLARNFRDVLRFTKGRAHNLVGDYLHRFDVANIKTVLRGITSGTSFDKVMEDIVPAGQVDEEKLRTMARSRTVVEAVDALRGTTFFGVLSSELEAQEEGVWDLAALENALDKAYLQGLVDSVSEGGGIEKVLRSYYRTEVDRVNARTLLRLRHDGVQPEILNGFVVPGGAEISEANFRKLAYIDGDDAFLAAMKDLPMFKENADLRSYLDGFKAPGGIMKLFLALEKGHLRVAERFGRMYPLSVLPLIDYIIKKETEVRNIRCIARGRATGLSEDDIKGITIL